MKQLLLRKGKVIVENVPAPTLSPKNILVEVRNSLISTGTEMASVKLSGSSLLTKAKERPKELSKVFNSIRVRGVMKTLSLVLDKLDESKPLGYSCAGRVVAVGTGVNQFKTGDRVACAGAGLANHAEIVSVPENLAVKIPAALDEAAASFVTIGAIALQGVRRADVRLGETVCVVGLGLIGQITAQLLVSAGCKVVGTDPDASRVELAKKNGLTRGSSDVNRVKMDIDELTSGMGVDATLITASTSSSDPTRLSFELTRKKGKIVVVGAVGMDLERSPFYEKEQDFLISCSYGPGRYDPNYEQHGHDYPYAYVRWTENRNMSAFLDLLAERKIDLSAMIGEIIPIDQSERAYDLLNGEGQKPLSILLSYPVNVDISSKIAGSVTKPFQPIEKEKIHVGLIGVGNFAKTVHIPHLKELRETVRITAVCAATGSSAETMSRQLGAPLSATDYRRLLSDSNVDAVIISTRHDKHAAIAREALQAGKHVFLEKPLALTEQELTDIDKAVRQLSPCPVLMVGFNRRYAPSIVQLKKAMADRKSPLVAIYRVNAGLLPPQHWVHGDEGGGRLRGEACHMIDLFQSLVNAPMRSYSASAVSPSSAARPDENFSAQLTYEDGSVCTLIYTSVGNAHVPKEWLEVHWNGLTAVNDDFADLAVHGMPRFNVSGKQDKGHREALQTFFSYIRTGNSFPTPWEQLVETTRACIELDRDVWGRPSESCVES